MKKLLPIILACTSFQLFAKECTQCKINREYNKDHPGKYEYYEDYLSDGKEQEKEKEERKENNEKLL